MIERGNPLLKQEEPKHVHLMTARVSTLKTKTAHDRTGQPVVETGHTNNVPDGSQTRSFHESNNFNVEDEANHDGTVKPVVCRDASHEQGHEQSMLNEVNIDLRIPGLPHSVVKQHENSRVRELVKKIENHPAPTISSTRSTTKQSLQPVQYDVKENRTWGT